MADTIKVPLLKKPLPKKAATIIGVGVVGVIGYVIWKRHTASSTAASTTVDTAAAIDPATGYAYGSSEDADALAQQANYYQSTAGSTGGGGGDSSSSVENVGTVISTNDQWDQAAVNYLSNTVGLDASTVSSALGKYLTGTAVTQGSTEDSIITQAIAAVGQPPVAGTNGYPPSIKHTTAATSAGVLSAPSLRVTATTATTVTVSWAAVAHANEYTVHTSAPAESVTSAALSRVIQRRTTPVTVTATAVDTTGAWKTSPSSNSLIVPATTPVKK